MALGIPPSCIGLQVSGDVAGETLYMDRYKRIVAFPKVWPTKPATPPQAALRARFKSAQAEYMSLTPSDKADYESLTKAASLALTGQNLFIHVAMMHTSAFLDTLMRQWGISVTPPTPV